MHSTLMKELQERLDEEQRLREEQMGAFTTDREMMQRALKVNPSPTDCR